jgi:DNA-binding beta-propeller fold protein YncE
MTNRITTRRTRISGLVVAGLLASGCAAGSGAPAGAAAPAVDAPLPGDNYAIVYESGAAIGVRDTRTGSDRPALAGTGEVLATAASATDGRVAVAQRTPAGTTVSVIDAASGSVAEVPDAAGGEQYTLVWSSDGTLLGIGVRGGTSGVFLLGADGVARSMGCSASDRIEAWRSPSQAVVHDDRNFYTVRTSDCATLARFTKVGHPGATFAPNGKRVAYYQDQPVQRQGGGTVQVRELWIAEHDGNGATKIADFRSRPRDHAWAPDGSKLVYEVESRRWANTSHLVVYDIPTAEYTFIAEEKDLGVPTDFAACWSPDGRRFAHERLYSRSTGTQQYSTRQVVVRTGESESVVFDEIVNQPPSTVRARGGPTCRWVSARHVLVSTGNGDRVIDADDGDTFRVEAGRRVLGAAVFEQGN